MNEHIETHPDFRFVANARELIDPEVLEQGTMTVKQIKELQQKADEPIRDFIWSTSDSRTRISQMSPEFLLVVARHCVHRANIYYSRVNFFMDVLEIVEEHAKAKGVEIPSTVDEIQAMLEDIQQKQAEETESDLPINVELPAAMAQELKSRLADLRLKNQE